MNFHEIQITEFVLIQRIWFSFFFWFVVTAVEIHECIYFVGKTKKRRINRINCWLNTIGWIERKQKKKKLNTSERALGPISIVAIFDSWKTIYGFDFMFNKCLFFIWTICCYTFRFNCCHSSSDHTHSEGEKKRKRNTVDWHAEEYLCKHGSVFDIIVMVQCSPTHTLAVIVFLYTDCRRFFVKFPGKCGIIYFINKQ